MSPVQQVPHAAWFGISSSIDHLHAVKALVVDAGVLHPYAPYSLPRAATENAATAVWLLSPPLRITRVQRRLKLAYNEVTEAAKARPFAAEAWAALRSPEAQKNELTDLAKSLGINLSDVAGRFSYEKIVEAAGQASEFGGDAAVFWWRLFSGFAHGRYWATLGLLDREDHPSRPASIRPSVRSV
jgi:hypothetical protein